MLLLLVGSKLESNSVREKKFKFVEKVLFRNVAAAPLVRSWYRLTGGSTRLRVSDHCTVLRWTALPNTESETSRLVYTALVSFYLKEKRYNRYTLCNTGKNLRPNHLP